MGLIATRTGISHLGLQSVPLKVTGWRMWGDQADTLTDMFSYADDELLRKVLNNPHVLFPLLPRKKEITHLLTYLLIGELADHFRLNTNVLYPCVRNSLCKFTQIHARG